MKIYTVQSLLLIMVLVIVRVYTASIERGEEITIRYIIKRAEELIKEKLPDELVPMIPGKVTNICTSMFFCLAEKILKNTTTLGESHLTHQVHQYNDKYGTLTCQLNTTSKHEHELRRFLKEIKDYADNALLQLTGNHTNIKE